MLLLRSSFSPVVRNEAIVFSFFIARLLLLPPPPIVSNPLYPSLSFSTPPIPNKSLFTQSFRLSFGLPLLILPSTPSAFALFVNRTPPMSNPLKRPPHQLPCETFSHTNVLPQLIHSSLVDSFHSRNSSHPIILANLQYLLFFFI